MEVSDASLFDLDIQIKSKAIRRTLPTALSSSPGANFPLRQPSSFGSPLPPPPGPPLSQDQDHHRPYMHERTPSQMARPDYAAILAGEGSSSSLGQPKARLIRSDTAFAHATEVRFDDLTYTVQKPAEGTGAHTVGAQCMRFWSWPFTCLLRTRQPADRRVALKVSLVSQSVQAAVEPKSMSVDQNIHINQILTS